MAAIVTTISDRCKHCYTCIRNCPAKAIRVVDGQAEVIEERCIACGNCFKMCAQGAKRVQDDTGAVRELLAGETRTLAALAPSFPAAFEDCTPGQVVSAIRLLGFASVLEVAFGAELVGREYRRLAQTRPVRTIISTPCPAVVSLIEHYYPSLLPFLAPVVSPVVALARAVKAMDRPDTMVVFIGPCIAKKAEIREPSVAGAVYVALTFTEIKTLLQERGIAPASLPESDPDPPNARLAGVFPLSGGLLKTAAMQADVLDTDVVVTEGKDNTLYVVRELEEGKLAARFLDLLFCEGCINGPVIDSRSGLFARRQRIGDHVKTRLARVEAKKLELLFDRYAGVDLSRTFSDKSTALPIPSEEEIRRILAQINKSQPADELNCGACGYPTCREKAVAVFQGLAETQMCLPYLVDQLQENVAKLRQFQAELQAAQTQLIHTEKLASVGQLAAGVAHEINNPLGTITLYSQLMLDDLPKEDPHAADLQMVVEEASRCRSIVSGLLDFARQGKLELEEVDLNALLLEAESEVTRRPQFERVSVVQMPDPDLPRIAADPAQLRQVFSNLVANSAEAMPDGGTVTLSTGVSPGREMVWASVSDTGCGIPEENLTKLFTPFFTTKPPGKGTGLGLAISYGIVKMHRGALEVQSEVGVGSTFRVVLPVRWGSVTDRNGAATDLLEG